MQISIRKVEKYSFARNIKTSRKRVKTSNLNNVFLVLVCYTSDFHFHIWWSVETNDKTAKFCDKVLDLEILYRIFSGKSID